MAHEFPSPEENGDSKAPFKPHRRAGLPDDPVVNALINYEASQANSRQARQEQGLRRERYIQDTGWTLVIQTTNEPIALWSDWMGSKFEIQYGGEPLEAASIRQKLAIEPGNAAEEEPGPHLDWRDADPSWSLETRINKLPQHMARYVNEEDTVTPLPRQPNLAMALHWGMPFGIEEASILTYRHNFITLAAELAFKAGQPTALTTEFALTLATPWDLLFEEYQVETQDRMVLGKKPHETVALLKGPELICPWLSLRRLSVGPEITQPQHLADRILTQDLCF